MVRFTHNLILLSLAGFVSTGCQIAAPGEQRAGAIPPTPAGMAFIPAGECEMGDALGVGYSNERPAHRVFVSGFFIEMTETTQQSWEQVHRWATHHGYEFESASRLHSELRPAHPVCNVNWYDTVKWANARSEMEGRSPVYYTDASKQQVYRRGRVDLNADSVRWETDGYRLPTEAEWEKAARGGLAGQNYPWSSPGTNFHDHLDGTRANYFESGDAFESDPECPTTPTGWFDGRRSAGPNMANGFALMDMAGNVSEWCWDWHDDAYYGRSGARSPDPRGPMAGVGRVLRGGSWISSPKYCRVSARYVSEAHYPCHCYGFRLVIGGRHGK